MWALLVFMALGLFALVMVFVMDSVDEKIKAGNFRVAVIKASLVTSLALVICAGPLLMPFTLVNVQHHWWQYLAPFAVVPGTLGEWHKVRQLWRQQHTE